MPNVITIDRQDVVALIEEAAKELTGSDAIEAVALAMWRLLDRHARTGLLFGMHRGSVWIREGVDLRAPVFDAETDREIGR